MTNQNRFIVRQQTDYITGGVWWCIIDVYQEFLPVKYTSVNKATYMAAKMNAMPLPLNIKGE